GSSGPGAAALPGVLLLQHLRPGTGPGRPRSDRKGHPMSCVDVPDGSDFPVENLPYGVFSTGSTGTDRPRIGVAIGDQVLDLAPVLDDPAFGEPTLNRSPARGRPRWR